MAQQRQRQNLGDLDGVPPVARPQRDRGWDKQHNWQVASYRLPKELQEEIRTIAKDITEKYNLDEKAISPADVARKLLEAGIVLYRKGEVELIPQPKKFTL